MKKSDYYLIALLLLLACGVYFYLNAPTRSNEKMLLIQHNHTVIKRVELSKVQGTEHLKLPVQDGTLEISYDNTGALVLTSPCPDKICVHQGKITKVGRSIACVPEKVLLTLEAPNKEAEEDAVVR